MTQYTPTEQRLIHLLSDGMPHPKAEVQGCIGDELSRAARYSALSALRKKLRPIGQEIVCETTGRATFYRHVRLLCDPTEG